MMGLCRSINSIIVGTLIATFVTITLCLSIDAPIEEINPCLGVECREGWVCKSEELPHCTIAPSQMGTCDPTPVCLPSPKIGSCPVITEIIEMEKLCESMICFQDDDCPDEEKCCDTEDCGMVCLHPGHTIV